MGIYVHVGHKYTYYTHVCIYICMYECMFVYAFMLYQYIYLGMYIERHEFVYRQTCIYEHI